MELTEMTDAALFDLHFALCEKLERYYERGLETADIEEQRSMVDEELCRRDDLEANNEL